MQTPGIDFLAALGLGLEISPLSLLATEAGRQLVREADLVFGHDLATGEDSLFYGQSLVGRALVERKRMPVKVVRVGYDSRAGELGQLAGAVRDLKGSCCHGEPRRTSYN